MRRLLTLLVLLALVGAGYAGFTYDKHYDGPTTALSITVCGAEPGMPGLFNARIRCTSAHVKPYYDDFPWAAYMPVGTNTFVISCDGYVTQEVTIEVLPQSDQKAVVFLTPQ